MEHSWDRPTTDRRSRPSGSGLAGLTHDLIKLVRLETRLAKTELLEKVTQTTRGISRIGLGGLMGYVGLVALLVAVALGYALFLDFWLSALLVGLLFIVLGAMLVQVGRNKLRQMRPLRIGEFTAFPSPRPSVQERTVQQTRSVAASPGARDNQAKTDHATANGAKPSLWQVLKQTVQEWIEDEASQLAAALSYYTAVSIAPLLVLVVVIVGFFLGQEAAQSQLLSQLQGAMGPEGTLFLQTVLENAEQPTLASLAGILSFLTLLWGATNVFSQLQNSLNAIWDVEKESGGLWRTLRARFLSFTMVLGIAFLLLVSLVISAALSTLIEWGHGLLPGADWIWQLVNLVVSFVVVTLLFAAIYKVLPDAQIVWRDVWLGAAVTALLFTIGKFLLGWYLANAGSAYGAVGSLVVFLLWVYYSAQILFLGAEFTQVYARHYGAGIQPVAGAASSESEPAPSAS